MSCSVTTRAHPAPSSDRLKGFDAIYFGAVGWPETVPDHVSLWGSLFLFRRGLDQYVNLRPARLMPGVASPLANRKVITMQVANAGLTGGSTPDASNYDCGIADEGCRAGRGLARRYPGVRHPGLHGATALRESRHGRKGASDDLDGQL